MASTTRHLLAGIAWDIASLFAWIMICNAIGRSFMYLVNERQMKLPEWSDTVFNWTGIAGIVLIPPAVAILAIRAYLPGTGKRPSTSRGFAVEHSQPPVAE